MLNVPTINAVPSHRAASPYRPSDLVTLPPPSHAAQAIDQVLADPVLSAELRSRGALKGQFNQRRGHRWIARQDGACNKRVGWLINPAGYLLGRECGALIPAGSECWRQDGHLYYGQGCHAKGLVTLPKLWVGEHVLNHSEFGSNLPDRQMVLKVSEVLWQLEVDAGNIQGQWGSQDYDSSIKRATDSVLTELRRLKNQDATTWSAGDAGRLLDNIRRPQPTVQEERKYAMAFTAGPILHLPTITPSKMTLKDKKSKAKPEKKAVATAPTVESPVVVEPPVSKTPLKGIVTRFAGPKAKTLAESYALQHNEGRKIRKLLPLVIMQENSQWCVVNPEIADQHVTITPLDPGQPVAVKARKK